MCQSGKIKEFWYDGSAKTSMRSQNILGVLVHDIENQSLDNWIKEQLKTGRKNVVYTPNAEMLKEAQVNPGYKDLLNKADLSLPDGVSLTYAAVALHGTRIEHRHTGVDTVSRLANVCANNDARMMLLGGAPEAAQDAAQNLQKEYQGDVIGLDPGQIHYNKKQVTISKSLIASIEREQPDIVAVAFGMEKQEQFIQQAKELLPNVRIWIGVGGAFEMISNQKQRAPGWMREKGIEWLWRLWIEPTRLKRILNATILFPLSVIKQTIKDRRFIKATLDVLKEVKRQVSV